jgi:transcriptional regulator with PAS, ATPase and Fis domain
MGNQVQAVGVRKQQGFVTQDPAMLNLLQMSGKIASTDVAVLIQGESGTGKELVAKRIHDLSSRKNNRLVSINCGAIQENLLPSELFGHEKGAVTGAVAQKKGLVEMADGGTLFINEIEEMGMEAQAKLLQFLQEGEFCRVGGKVAVRVDVRIISATNKELESQVKAGKFREDLYYRINTVSLRTSPLRKRPEDIPLLVHKFLTEGATEVRNISARAMDVLKRYPWPGNVRELQNTLERFKILVESETINEQDIPFNIQHPGAEVDYFDNTTNFLLENVERRHILKVLAYFKGNKTKAAAAMGITVKTLYNKLSLYDHQSRQQMI